MLATYLLPTIGTWLYSCSEYLGPWHYLQLYSFVSSDSDQPLHLLSFQTGNLWGGTMLLLWSVFFVVEEQYKKPQYSYVYALSSALLICRLFCHLQRRATSQRSFRMRLPWWPYLMNILKNGLWPATRRVSRHIWFNIFSYCIDFEKTALCGVRDKTIKFRFFYNFDRNFTQKKLQLRGKLVSWQWCICIVFEVENLTPFPKVQFWTPFTHSQRHSFFFFFFNSWPRWVLGAKGKAASK